MMMRSRSKARRRGVALMIVLIIMALLTCFAVTNGVALSRLKKFLDQVEQNETGRIERGP